MLASPDQQISLTDPDAALCVLGYNARIAPVSSLSGHWPFVGFEERI